MGRLITGLQTRAILVASCLLIGCTGRPPEMIDRWIASSGGLCHGPDADRLQSAAADLIHQFPGRSASLHVLNDFTPGAYAWPDGRIFITRGLIDILDDQGLAAAVAHELGHLLADGHLHHPSSIGGTRHNHDSDQESEADDAGIELLRASGRDPDSMRQMLTRLRTSFVRSKRLHRSLTCRIERLVRSQ